MQKNALQSTTAVKVNRTNGLRVLSVNRPNRPIKMLLGLFFLCVTEGGRTPSLPDWVRSGQTKCRQIVRGESSTNLATVRTSLRPCQTTER